MYQMADRSLPVYRCWRNRFADAGCLGIFALLITLYCLDGFDVKLLGRCDQTVPHPGTFADSRSRVGEHEAREQQKCSGAAPFSFVFEKTCYFSSLLSAKRAVALCFTYYLHYRKRAGQKQGKKALKRGNNH